MRIILFTGKGGVGKTTMAAATAMKAAREGYRTLVMSTDPAHSLADALDLELGPEPVEIAPNLYGQEFDVYYSMKKYWGNMREMMRALFRFRGLKNVVAEELSVLPGMEEASAFLWIEKFYNEDEYDLIVIDSAPTGETLTLLSLPQVMQSWVTKAFPGQSFAVKTMGALVRKMTDIPIDKGYEELENLFEKLERVQKIFLDTSQTSIRLVANPERMVIQEAKRAYTYLQLYGYNVDAILVNRILPEEAAGSYFDQYLKDQKSHLEDIEESFAGLPLLTVGHLGHEVFGLDMLEKIGEELYQNADPAEIMFEEKPFLFVEHDKTYELRLKLPFIGEEDFKLQKFGDEIVINIGNRRKTVFLPRFANFLQMSGHTFDDPWLTITLAK
ncbi:MAG: ArsA family ATPase [Bacteroidia bacterium]